MSMSDEKKPSGLPGDNPPSVPETHNREKRASAPVNPGKPPVEPGDTLVVTAPKTTPAPGKIVPGSGSVTADLGKKSPSRIQAENSAAIHATAKWSTAQLQKTLARQAAIASAAAAAQAKAKTDRDALTGYLKDIVNHAIRKNYSNPTVIALAHANNMAMQGEAMRLNAAKAERKARKKAEEEARKAEEALKVAQRKKAEADRLKAETEKKLKQAKEQEARAKAKADADKAAADKADAAARAKAAAEAKAKASAAARARAAAEAKAKAAAEAKARDELFAKAGIKPVPEYTPEMVKAAEAALGSAGVMALSRTPGAMQFSVAGWGVWTATGEVLSTLGTAISRGIAALGATATASTVGPVVTAASTILFSAPAGSGSDKVPGRDLEAMFALNAQMLAGQGVKIEPGVKSVNLPVRGQLVNSNGQLALQLLKTGASLPAAVPVLNAVRDAATGLDRITVPAVAGAPSRTVLVNPAPAPARPSNTGNQKPVPVTPVHTGTAVKPMVTPVTTTTPMPDAGGLRDFIYWRPDATGTGVEPVYVMLSGPYGKTNARGEHSGRPYNPDKAGFPVQNLDWKTATIDRAGVDKVKLHTGRFGESPDNKVMIDRLEKILKGEQQPTDIDRRYYTHEIRELDRYRALGVPDGVEDESVWNDAHTATLEDYKVNEKTQPLYTPEAKDAYEKAELKKFEGGQ